MILILSDFFSRERDRRGDAKESQHHAPRKSNKETMTTTPHQSKGRLVRFPGATLAAQELGVSRGHLHRVLIGERKSPSLSARWNAWLTRNPQFASLQPRR